MNTLHVRDRFPVVAAGALAAVMILAFARTFYAKFLFDFVVWAWVHDWRKRGRVHPAFIFGGLALLVSIPLRAWIGYTDTWLPIARWIVEFGR